METITLRSLASTCKLGPELVLPAADYLHNPTGVAYQHAAFAPKPARNATYGTSIHLRGGNDLVYHGEALRELDFVLKTNPYICDLRCYVPVYFTPDARKKSRPDVKLDRVITVETRDAPGAYHLHAILTRSIAEKKARKLAETGVTVEKIDLTAFTPIAYENALRLYRGLRLSNVELLRLPAKLMAGLLQGRSETALKTRLERLLKRFQANPAMLLPCQCEVRGLGDLYRWTYASIVLGYLPVDLNQIVTPYQPIRLLRARRGGMYVYD